MDVSPLLRFAPSLDVSGFATWTFRPQDVSPPGRFAHSLDVRGVNPPYYDRPPCLPFLFPSLPSLSFSSLFSFLSPSLTPFLCKLTLLFKFNSVDVMTSAINLHSYWSNAVNMTISQVCKFKQTLIVHLQ